MFVVVVGTKKKNKKRALFKLDMFILNFSFHSLDSLFISAIPHHSKSMLTLSNF